MKTVLFVCVHNSGRSQMAEAFFNRFAAGQAHALSAGTAPAQEINPTVAQAMAEIGYDLAGQRPKLLTQEMLDQADIVITMGCAVEGLCPAPGVKAEDWGLPDPQGRPLEEVRKIRDEIKARVLD